MSKLKIGSLVAVNWDEADTALMSVMGGKTTNLAEVKTDEIDEMIGVFTKVGGGRYMSLWVFPRQCTTISQVCFMSHGDGQ